jgi:hypothetical protein
MAAAGSWDSIREHGLLSTGALVSLWEISPPEKRESLLGQRRPVSLKIVNDALGEATIRDQIPLDEASLASALVDMTPHDWYLELNKRVFFFLQEQRLEKLLGARSYRNDEHVVIALDTASLVGAHSKEIELCKINSGFAQPHSKARRGRDTFVPIEQYEHRDRMIARDRPPWDVSELTVPTAVLDIERHVVSVERRKRNDILEVLFSR